MITAPEYIGFLDREYLADYVTKGGAAVKFAVVSGSPDVFHANLARAAQARDYVHVRVDADVMRVHMIDQVFFAVARQVDWFGLAESFVCDALDRLRLSPPEEGGITAEALAAHYSLDAAELARDVRRELQQSLLRDYEMAQEFRRAMLRICEAVIDSSDAAAAESDAVLEWLRGELRLVSRLRPAAIFRKIARHNARHMLFSLARWLTRNGHAGLVLDLDVTRCAVAKRPPPEERDGLYYSKAAVMDAYEVLRQLIDATDELRSCLVVVVSGPELLTDEKRGVESYPALQLRIIDEVRDRRRDNPFSSLVRVGAGT